MTEAAIAANGGFATGTQKAEAAMYGLRIEVDATGKAIVTSMKAGEDATRAFGSAVDSATSKLEAQNAALERQISAQEKANDLKQRAIDLENKRKGIDSEGFSVDPRTGKRFESTVDVAAQKALAEVPKDGMTGLYDPMAYAKLYAFYKGQQDAQLDAAAQAGKKSAMGAGVVGARPNPGGENAGPSMVPAPMAAKTYDVRVNNSTVRTYSDDDAQRLIQILKNGKLAS